ncbi:hypothetical protein RIF29_25929 [Crotalaria pallida]|uniref:Ubiquitin-like protease family profile domain-containing protein n=1 Tax=Crotalaria pallida TaxID=3830 RepID=A0AAN9EN23_CROPI
MQSLKKRVSTLEEHDAGHSNSIKLLELIVLKKQPAAPSSEHNNVGADARQVIDLDAEHIGSQAHEVFRAHTQGKSDFPGNSSPTFDFPPSLTANFILQVSDDKGGSDLNNIMSTPNLKLGNLYGESGAPRSSKLEAPRSRQDQVGDKPPSQLKGLLQELVVFTVYAMKVALTQKYYSSIKTWHLPPSFIEDLKCGKSITEMLDLYKNTWMNLTPDLKFIYVPIQEYSHWYLMVVSIPDRTVYLVDSHLPDHYIQDRRTVILNVLKEMSVRIKTVLMMAMDPFNQLKIEIEQDAERRWEQFA